MTWGRHGPVHGGQDVASGLHQEVRWWALDCGGQVHAGGWICVGRVGAGRNAGLCVCLGLLLTHNEGANWIGWLGEFVRAVVWGQETEGWGARTRRWFSATETHE